MKKNLLFFDLDGVVVKECGVAEFGYAFLLQYLDQFGSFDLKGRLTDLIVGVEYIQLAEKLRSQIKGKHPCKKVNIWRNQLRSKATGSDEEIVEIWYEAQRSFIVKTQTPESYRMPGILKLLDFAKRHQSVFIATATANEQKQADFLVNYAGVKEYFDYVLGFDLYNEKLLFDNKMQMLKYFVSSELESNGIVSDAKVFMIGDGVPDMEAGRAVGAVCVGIAHDQKHFEALKGAGADVVFLVTDSEGWDCVIQWLGTQGLE